MKRKIVSVDETVIYLRLSHSNEDFKRTCQHEADACAVKSQGVSVSYLCKFESQNVQYFQFLIYNSTCFQLSCLLRVGRDSSVGIATR